MPRASSLFMPTLFAFTVATGCKEGPAPVEQTPTPPTATPLPPTPLSPTPPAPHPIDTLAPTVPEGGTAVPVSTTRIDLSWLASTDDTMVDHYELFRDEDPLPLATLGTTDFSDTDLVPQTLYTYSVRAVDSAGNASALSAPFAAITLAQNQIPVLVDPGDQADEEGAVISLDVVATDPDGDALEFGATGLPPGLSIDPVAGTITGQIALGAATGSPYGVGIMVQDGQGVASVGIDWIVEPALVGVNQPPVLEDPGDQSDPEGGVVSLTLVAMDADGDALAFSATGLPPGLAIDPDSGVVSGAIDSGASASSPYGVELVADDGQASDSVSVVWSVLDPIQPVPGALYVAPNGDDNNPGTQAEPWASVDHAVSLLDAGDTLYLRGGTYFESGLSFGVTGTLGAPVVIQSFPGESAILDGGLQEFRLVGNSDWELVDGAIDLYRSTATFALSDVAGKFEHQGTTYSLSRYEEMDDLSATNEFVGTGARYVGPGVFYGADDRIYIRLQPSSAASLNGVFFDVPTDLDPRQNRIFLNDSTTAMTLESDTAFLTIRGVDLRYHYHGLRLRGAHDVVVENLSITMNYVGIRLDEGSHHVRVDDVVFNAFFPPWVAWTDMKGSDGQYQPIPTIKPVGISGTDDPLLHDVEIRECLFDGVFDGHVFDAYALEIHHNTYRVLDDMTQLGTNSYDVEIHHNRIIGPGISHNGRGDSSSFPGTKYIHHNLIDATHPMLWGRHDPSGILRSTYTGWHGQHAFPTHTGAGPGDGDPWKIYHNTVLYDGSSLSGGMGFELWRGVNTTGQAHEVYNNLFIQMTDHPIVDDQSTVEGLQVYDGNLYHRIVGASALFEDIADAGGTSSYDSLSGFLASGTFVESQAFYAPGWDSSSVEGDPQLVDPANGDYRPGVGGPAANGALEIDALGFPGLGGAVYRGATDPAGSESIGRTP